MEVLRIDEIRSECRSSSTLFVSPDPEKWPGFVPGQFVMVWIPGVDEVLMSVSYIDKDPLRIGITVQGIGEATDALRILPVGSHIGIRGPYGRGFDLSGKKRLVGICGGVGAASIVLALERAKDIGRDIAVLSGFRSKELVMFEDRFGRITPDTHISTDDGSYGFHGLVTDLLRKELETNDAELIACGPEMMMKAVLDIGSEFGVHSQCSLERYMKCGVGVCDSCSVTGHRVCQDGPVFTDEEIEAMPEFGSSHRDRSGRVVPLRECVR